MSLEFTGKLLVKGDVNQVTDKFKKREFVLEKTEIVGQKEFTEYVKFQLTQDRTNLIEPINLDDEVKVNFNLRGNKWEKDGNVNYFTNLEAWKIESLNQSNQGPHEITQDDDLPF